MSSFSGLTNALAALNAQRYGLDVTGQNISNASTPGYTRQRAEFGEVAPAAGVPSLYATQRGASGVTVTGTTRMNDPVLDSRVRAEHGKNGQTQTAATALSGVETLIDEPSDNGLAAQLSDFWKSWSAMANNPGGDANGLSARNVVLQKGATVAASLNATSGALDRLTQSASDQLNQTVVDVNDAANSLAKLNGAIAVASATGAPTNALADQRDALLLQLADNAGATASLAGDGQVTVTLGGQTLVNGTTATAVAVTSAHQLTVGGAAAGPAGGAAQGLVDAISTVLPGYSAQLDSVAAALSSTVNGAMAAGYDLAGNAGTPFFSGTTAGTISVALSDPTKLAASGVAGGNLDASNASAVANFGTLAGGADGVYQSFVSGLASSVQSASQQATVQSSVTASVDAQAQSVSGVSLDEETTSLLTFQRSYQAASRVLTTVDDTLDTLINRTGRVGL
ncbi:MAG TPA: flagellar hook-associated protein FlgK [Jatrophihabitans sp.]|jgi:flagellar hook-associated protein 1 FlgK